MVRFDEKSGCNVIPIKSVKHDANLALIRSQMNNPLLAGNQKPVLFFHGATVPTMMTSAYKIDGLSWFDALAASGRLVWGLDLLGYGESDQYPTVDLDGDHSDPENYGVAGSLIEEIDNAVEFILSESRETKLHVIAISRGAIPAGYYCAAFPEKIQSLTFHGPITRQGGNATDLVEKFFGTTSIPRVSHFALSSKNRFELLRDDKPEGTISPLEPGFTANWVRDYCSRVHGDPNAVDQPVLAPMGFAVDIFNAWNDIYFDETKLTMPTFILRGEWDHVLTSLNISCHPMIRSG